VLRQSGPRRAADVAANLRLSRFCGSTAIARWKEASASKPKSKSTRCSIRPILGVGRLPSSGFNAKARSDCFTGPAGYLPLARIMPSAGPLPLEVLQTIQPKANAYEGQVEWRVFVILLPPDLYLCRLFRWKKLIALQIGVEGFPD